METAIIIQYLQRNKKKLDGQDLKFILLCCEEIKENGLVFFEHDKASIEEFERFASETDIKTFEIHDQNDYILYLKLRDWNYETREHFWKRNLGHSSYSGKQFYETYFIKKELSLY